MGAVLARTRKPLAASTVPPKSGKCLLSTSYTPHECICTILELLSVSEVCVTRRCSSEMRRLADDALRRWRPRRVVYRSEALEGVTPFEWLRRLVHCVKVNVGEIVMDKTKAKQLLEIVLSRATDTIQVYHMCKEAEVLTRCLLAAPDSAVFDVLADDYLPHGTLLHLACRASSSVALHVVPLLLADPRIDVNATDDLTGRTPLHEAVQHNDMVDVVKLLLTSTAIEVNVRDRGDGSWSNGLAPLHYACTKGNWKVAVTLLKDDRVDVNIRTKCMNRTPLMCAITSTSSHSESEAHILIGHILSHKNFDATLVDSSGTSPLHIAARKGRHTYAFERLLSDGRFSSHVDSIGTA